jgi:hypothetical protein
MVYIVVYYFMVVEGRKAYLFFASIKEGVGGYEDDMQTQISNADKGTTKSSNSNGETKSEISVDEVCFAHLSDLRTPKANRVRSRGEIWMRQTLSKGGDLILCYGVLERGKLDIYKSEAVCSNFSLAH